MIRLVNALRAWGTPSFEDVLKQEVAQLDLAQLPLQQGLTTGNQVSPAPLTMTIHHVAETAGSIRVRAGIFYRSVIGGCSCEGDPTPTSENEEYCEVQLDIDKISAATTISLVQERE